MTPTVTTLATPARKLYRSCVKSNDVISEVLLSRRKIYQTCEHGGQNENPADFFGKFHND